MAVSRHDKPTNYINKPSNFIPTKFTANYKKFTKRNDKTNLNFSSSDFNIYQIVTLVGRICISVMDFPKFYFESQQSKPWAETFNYLVLLVITVGQIRQEPQKRRNKYLLEIRRIIQTVKLTVHKM
ncbi:unnamed protein product [Brugia timori]|uniref:Uncharacterized protein n=1 Tax=Brugia timori TaxID=42155 RepID=A0A0R3Q4A2_9BILA|nr:unnamed protein product [Brugia timori]